MAQPKTPPKPTIAELRARQGNPVPPDELQEIEAKAVRLIQIQAEQRRLEDEKGWTDPHSGERHRGLVDELQELFVIHNVRGIVLEDYTVAIRDGSNSRIDAVLLANEGVTGEQIANATVKTNWCTVSVTKKRAPGDKSRRKGDYDE